MILIILCLFFTQEGFAALISEEIVHTERQKCSRLKHIKPPLQNRQDNTLLKEEANILLPPSDNNAAPTFSECSRLQLGIGIIWCILTAGTVIYAGIDCFYH